MRVGVALLFLVAVTTPPAPVAAQWDIGFEISTTRYRGSSHDTTGSNSPLTLRPANATNVGLRVDRAIGRARLGLRASYASVGLTAAGPGLVLIDNSTGQLLEGQLLANFQVVGIGSSGAIRAEVGPSLHLWKSGDELRSRTRALDAAAYDRPGTNRFSGAIRLEGTLSKSWFDAGDLPPRS